MFQEAINAGDRLAVLAYADWLEERGLPLARGWRRVSLSGMFPGRTDYGFAYGYGWKLNDELPICWPDGRWGPECEVSLVNMQKLCLKVGNGDIFYRAYWGWGSPFAAMEALAEVMDEFVL